MVHSRVFLLIEYLNTAGLSLSLRSKMFLSYYVIQNKYITHSLAITIYYICMKYFRNASEVRILFRIYHTYEYVVIVMLREHM